MEPSQIISLKNELLLAEEEQSFLSKKILSCLRLRILGVTILLFSIIVKTFFLEKLTDKYDKYLLWLPLTLFGLVLWGVGIIKMKSTKKGLLKNDNKISKLKIEITN
jgi:hypothetical protein